MKIKGMMVVLCCALGSLDLAHANLPQEIWHVHTWQTTPIVGISGGYAVRSGSLQSGLVYSENNGQFAQPPSATVVRDYSDNGFIYGIMGGYQGILERWLMGLELNLDWQDIDALHPFAFSDDENLVGWNGSSRYRREKVVGLSGRVGYVVTTDFLPYFRFGAEIARDKLSTRFFGSDVFPVSITLEDKSWVYRFLIGAGIEVPIPCTQAVIRFEYDVHSKGKTVESNGAIVDGQFNPVFYSYLQPYTQSARIALVRYFY